MSCTYDLLEAIAEGMEIARSAHVGAINHPSAELRAQCIDTYQYWLAVVKHNEEAMRWYLRYNRMDLIAKCKAE